MIRNKQVAKAVKFSTVHPHAKIKEIAEKFGVTTKQIYMARYNHGVTNKPSMVKALKKLPVVVSTSPKPIADMVNHPPHYKAGGIETIDFIEAKKLNYNLGNVVKYVSRADHKSRRVEDLKKAKWYLEREIEKLIQVA